MRVFLCMLVCAAVVQQAARGADGMQAGAAIADITAPIPFRMHGYFYERLSSGTKDPLHARAVVMSDGKTSAAFVFCDLVGVPASITGAARKKASEATGIPVENIAIGGTHTHTGPQFFMSVNDHWHEQAVEKHGKDPYDSAAYREQLVEKISGVISEAAAALEPVQMSAGHALEKRISFNRRYHMKDGSVRFNPPIDDPNIIEPAGPIDPQVGIVTFTPDGGERPSSAMISFAMHPDTAGGGTLYSADYIYPLEQRLKQAFGDNFIALFGIGTCGDINHRDIKSREQRSSQQLGDMLGDTVSDAIENGHLGRLESPSLSVRTAKVDGILQKYSAAEVIKAKADMARLGERNFPFSEAVVACKIADVERLKRLWGDAVPLEVQAFRLDDETAIVTLPSEIFVNLGLAIKAASPFKTTLVIELVNDSVGYIPTRKAYQEGSYEVTNSRFVPGTGEKLAGAAIELLKDLK